MHNLKRLEPQLREVGGKGAHPHGSGVWFGNKALSCLAHISQRRIPHWAHFVGSQYRRDRPHPPQIPNGLRSSSSHWSMSSINQYLSCRDGKSDVTSEIIPSRIFLAGFQTAGVPVTPYLTALGELGEIRERTGIAADGHPAGAPGATGVERLRPRENVQRGEKGVRNRNTTFLHQCARNGGS